jgi:hypothetical protein
MKFLVALLLFGGLLFALPRLQPLLLRVLVDQKVEQLKDGMKESIPSVDPGLPVGSPELGEANSVVGEVALPLPIQ